jgi:riboflavin kinase/FMN adenylyltransferase
MLLMRNRDDLNRMAKPLHLALGVFDGVHLGHQAVIAAARQRAGALGGSCGVVTFDPHPIRVLAPERAPRQLLASLEHKARLLGRLDMAFLLALEFNRALAEMSAEDFLQWLVGETNIATLAVGEDWRFGKDRVGDVALLRKAGVARGFEVVSVAPVMHDGERISSTRIRQTIRDGAMNRAAEMLGRPYSVEGRVAEGRQLGRTLGFPTANVVLGEEQLPPDGVWAVRGCLDEVSWNGVANLGSRPTVDGTNHTLEVHLFDYFGDLYGRLLEVEFVHYLRDERKFASLDELREQITIDAEKARSYFS